MNLVLGTANFNHIYGLNKKKVSKKDIDKILLYLKKNNIKCIDSAEQYYDKRDLLFNKIKNFKLNTKISNIKGFDQKSISINLNKKIYTILKSYKIKKINILFLHYPQEILNSKKGQFLINSLKEAKRNKLISKIGYSVYNQKEAEKFIKFFKPDIIQIPFNIIDRRLIETGFAYSLKKKNIKIQVRSIFLQGLMTNMSVLKKKSFYKFKNILIKWFNWLNKKDLSPEEGAIQFILKYKLFFDSVVIGVDNFKHFKKNVSIFKNKKKIMFPKIRITNKNIVDPRKW